MVDHVKVEGKAAVKHRWGVASSCVRKRKRRRKTAASVEDVEGEKSGIFCEDKVLLLGWVVLHMHA